MTTSSFRAGGVSLHWDPETRLLRQVYGPNARPTAADARPMQAWIDERVGREQPFRMIIDLEYADPIALAWRYRWMSWTYVHRKQLRAAAVNIGRVGQTTIRAFARGTHVDLRGFLHEDEARAWLASPAEPI